MKATLIGLGINALMAGAKMLAGIFGHSQALIADGIESTADVVSSLIVWRGVVVAAAPADKDHPYGHGKAEALAAVGVTFMLIGAAFWIAVEAIHQIVIPHQAPAAWTLLVLVAVIAVKEMLFRFVRREALALENTAVETDAWHHRSDAITSLAAFMGILVAVLGGPGFEAADDYAALLAASIIAWNGLRLVGPAMNELMDAMPNTDLAERVAIEAAKTPGVQRIEKCLVRKMGGQYYVDMHVEVDPQMSVLQAHDIAHILKDNVREKIPAVRDVLVHIEPAGRHYPGDSSAVTID